MTHVEITDKIGTLDPPLWILCEYPTTLDAAMFVGQSARASLDLGTMRLVRNKLGWLLRIVPTVAR